MRAVVYWLYWQIYPATGSAMKEGTRGSTYTVASYLPPKLSPSDITNPGMTPQTWRSILEPFCGSFTPCVMLNMFWQRIEWRLRTKFFDILHSACKLRSWSTHSCQSMSNVCRLRACFPAITEHETLLVWISFLAPCFLQLLLAPAMFSAGSKDTKCHNMVAKRANPMSQEPLKIVRNRSEPYLTVPDRCHKKMFPQHGKRSDLKMGCNKSACYAPNFWTMRGSMSKWRRLARLHFWFRR